MNPISRAILQTLLVSDQSLCPEERCTFHQLIDGKIETSVNVNEPVFVTQKMAAKMLSVSRATIWRMTRNDVLHPIEILPGTLRYPYHEMAALMSK